MRIVGWQMILMKHHTFFFYILGKMLQNLSSAVVVIGALRVKVNFITSCNSCFNYTKTINFHCKINQGQYMFPDIN